MGENISTLIVIFVFAIVTQFFVDRVKDIAGEKVMKVIPAPIWSLVFGVLFALMFDIDFFAMIGYQSSLPTISKVFTGLIFSSGSSGVHELLAKLRESRNV